MDAYIAEWTWFALGMVTASVYGWDKHKARTGGRRVSERTLLLWAAAGGWVGGLMAMWATRHKLRKRSFMVRFWMAAIIGTALWITIYWRTGFFLQ